MILMQEKDDRFYIKESTIPDGGMGLFAKVPIKKGSTLPIKGVQVQVDSAAGQCTEYARNYKFAACDKKKDRCIVPLGFAALVNHANDAKSKSVEIRALYHSPASDNFTGKMAYYFLRDVEADEEILGDYGAFWGGVFNWAIKEKSETKSAGTEEDWKTFLSHGLYNLGELIEEITKE